MQSPLLRQELLAIIHENPGLSRDELAQSIPCGRARFEKEMAYIESRFSIRTEQVGGETLVAPAWFIEGCRENSALMVPALREAMAMLRRHEGLSVREIGAFTGATEIELRKWMHIAIRQGLLEVIPGMQPQSHRLRPEGLAALERISELLRTGPGQA